MAHEAVEASINQWGNGLAVRLTKRVAKTAGVTEGTLVRIVAQPGRIIVETAERELTIEDMLASFDPKRHSGEAMASVPLGVEAL